MATFSVQSHPVLIDSIFLPNTPNKVSGFMDMTEPNISSHCFSQFYHDSSPVGLGHGFHERTSVVHSENEVSTVTNKKHSTDEQGRQKKRTRNGTALKGGKGGKTKKHNDGSKAVKKDQKKALEEPPTGYIHVRAKRGQATDSHSLAERVRREKISERMKTLQRLVPGCDKVTGKALMLDEIINYVQSLQDQVEFLSMKLASFNPMFYDFGMDLETLMIRPERFNSTETSPPLPMAPSLQTTIAPSHNFPLLDVSAALFLQHGQRPHVFSLPQDNGSLLWDMEDQRQNIFHSSELNDNLCFFH